MEFLSPFPVERLRKMPDMKTVVNYLGISNNLGIITPPKCPCCKSFIYVDEETGFYQCFQCMKVGRVYKSKKLSLRIEWEEVGK